MHHGILFCVSLCTTDGRDIYLQSSKATTPTAYDTTIPYLPLLQDNPVAKNSELFWEGIHKSSEWKIIEYLYLLLLLLRQSIDNYITYYPSEEAEFQHTYHHHVVVVVVVVVNSSRQRRG